MKEQDKTLNKTCPVNSSKESSPTRTADNERWPVWLQKYASVNLGRQESLTYIKIFQSYGSCKTM